MAAWLGRKNGLGFIHSVGMLCDRYFGIISCLYRPPRLTSRGPIAGNAKQAAVVILHSVSCRSGHRSKQRSAG